MVRKFRVVEMNKIELTGRLTKDIEIKVTQNNKRVAEFSLAVKKNKEEANFINIVCWEQKADFLSNYATKGTLIAVTGSLETNNYVNKDGNKVYQTYVLADGVEILSKPTIQNPYQTSLNGTRDVTGYQDDNYTNSFEEQSELPFY